MRSSLALLNLGRYYGITNLGYCLVDRGEGAAGAGRARAPLRAFNRDAEDLDALLKRQAIGQILDHAAGITQHADAITGDLQAVSDKATKDYLTPKPFWRKFGQYAGDTFDVGAFLARHY